MRHPCIDTVFDVSPLLCSKAARTLCLGVSLWMGFSSIALAESSPQWLVTATHIDGATDAVEARVSLGCFWDLDPTSVADSDLARSLLTFDQRTGSRLSNSMLGPLQVIHPTV